MEAALPRPRAKSRSDVTAGDRVLRAYAAVSGGAPVFLLVVLALVMIISAWPAIIYSGTYFLTGTIFTFGNLYGGSPTIHNGITAPHNAQYGGGPFLFGTLATSLIALAIAIPVAVGGALMLVERVPRRLQPGLSLFLELLAGIPSVVYGLWAIIYLGPLASQHVYPFLGRALGWIPAFRAPFGQGQGLLTAGIVLSIMIFPIIAATTRDLLATVPILHKEGALALGMTRFETTRVVTLPFIRNGIVAAALLGWARALGETMAVLMIAGNALNIYPYNIFAPTSTIAATIAALLDGALTDATGMAVHALAEAGLLLLATTLVTNFVARWIVRRTTGAALPVGRGL